MPRFNPNAGGHAPGHLRGLFWALLALDEADAEGHWPYRQDVEKLRQEGFAPLEPRLIKGDPLSWVAAQLRNCSDVMPFDGCETLGVDRSSTYAVGARLVMRQLADPASELSRRSDEREAMALRFCLDACR